MLDFCSKIIFFGGGQRNCQFKFLSSCCYLHSLPLNSWFSYPPLLSAEQRQKQTQHMLKNEVETIIFFSTSNDIIISIINHTRAAASSCLSLITQHVTPALFFPAEMFSASFSHSAESRKAAVMCVDSCGTLACL